MQIFALRSVPGDTPATEFRGHFLKIKRLAFGPWAVHRLRLRRGRIATVLGIPYFRSNYDLVQRAQYRTYTDVLPSRLLELRPVVKLTLAHEFAPFENSPNA